MKDWVRERDTKVTYANILQELRLIDHENFRKYLRMNTDTFQVALITFVLLYRFAFHDNKLVNSSCFFSSTEPIKNFLFLSVFDF